MPRKPKIPVPPDVTEFRNNRKEYRQETARHVFVMEADLTQTDKVHIFGMAERARKAGNELTGIMQDRIVQMKRTRKYHGLCKASAACKSSDKKEKKRISKEFEELREQYELTKSHCTKAMEDIAKRYDLLAVFGLTLAEDVWEGVEKVLFKEGRRLHFHKREDLPGLQAKQSDRAIVMKEQNGELRFKLGDLTFGLKKKPEEMDRFEMDEIEAILTFLRNGDAIEKDLIEHWKKTGEIIDSYRPCYATLVCKTIRGKLRVYVHITVEGRPMPKFRKDGTPKHALGKGRVSADIGTQTIAYMSETETDLINLCERGDSPERIEHELQLIDRKMERSRRMSNPQNYNRDGTVKRGVKLHWTHSKRYMKLKERKRILERRAAINRHLAANELANHLRSLGDVFITEPKNAAKLAKRAKKTTYNKKGRANRKGRFGKSIHRRIPGYVQSRIKEVFERTGGEYHEVPMLYRASQFDHTNGTYYKKSLSTRKYHLSDGSRVLRDWYSCFLLWCADEAFDSIDASKCTKAFPKAFDMQNAMIDGVLAQKKKVLNSGLKVG